MYIYSFFSGLGSLDLGFESAGFNIAFVNEYNPLFLESYKYARRNNNTTPLLGYNNCSAEVFLDDNTWNSVFHDQHELFGFIGGPPCPDFSVAGKNRGAEGKNGRLTTIYFDLIRKRKPAFFVFENVKGLYRTKKHREYYESQKSKLLQDGYVLFDKIFNSLEYGVPQYRDRLFLVGFRRDIFGNCEEFKFDGNKLYSLKDIRNISWPTMSTKAPKTAPQGIIEPLTVQYWFDKNDVTHHPNAKDIFKVRKPERFINTLEGDVSKKSFKRLHRWRYSPTAAYGNNEVHMHPYKARRISVAEALAIQSLPAWFSLPEKLSLSNKFKMVGNCVPFMLAKGIAQNIYDFISHKCIE